MLPAGAETRRVTSRSHAEPCRLPSTARPPPPPLPRTSASRGYSEENRNLADSEEISGKKERIDDTEEEEKEEVEVEVKEESGEVGRKVCGHCGWECSELQYPFHVRSHKPWLNCSLCSFTTKASDRFKAHGEAHEKGKLSVRSASCRGQYSSEASQKIHYRQMHGIIRCRDCPDWIFSVDDYASHRDEVHNDPAPKRKDTEPVGASLSKRSEYVCQLCMKECGVHCSDISDEFLAAQEAKLSKDKEPPPCGSWKRDPNGLPALMYLDEDESDQLSDGGQDRGFRVNADVPDTSGVRTNDPFPELLAEIPFVSVETEDSVDPCVPCSPEGGESVISSGTGMSETEPSSSSERSLGQRMNFLQNLTRLRLKCVLCAENFPKIEELILHCKNAHNKKVKETSSSGPWETRKNPRSSQKRRLPNPSVVLETNLDPVSGGQRDPLSDNLVDTSEEEDAITTVGKGEVKVCQVRLKKNRAETEIPCSKCPEVFSSLKALKRHQDRHRKEESKKSLICPECGRAFLSRVRLYRHLRVGHRDKLRCSYRCPLLFSSEEEVSDHYRKFHETATSSACKYCGLDYLSTGLLQNHLKSCSRRPPEKRSYTCKSCGDIFKISRECKLHVKKCAMSNDSESLDANTINGSSLGREGMPLVVCSADPLYHETALASLQDSNPREFSSVKSDPISEEQLNPLSDDLVGPPEEDPVTTEDKEELKVPKVRKMKIKAEIPCSKCHKVFATQRAFNRDRDRHLRAESKKSFSCPVCDKFCISRMSVISHLKKCHKDKLRCRYACPLVFNSREEVSEHYIKSHKMAAFSPCPYCGSGFLYAALLQKHLERCQKCPPGERPSYACESCGNIFTFSRDYKLHVTKCTLSKDFENIDANTSNGSSLGREEMPSEPCSLDPLSRETALTSLQDPNLCQFSSPISEGQLDPLPDNLVGPPEKEDPVSAVGKVELKVCQVRVKRMKVEIRCSKCPKVFPSLRARNRHKDVHRREKLKKSCGCPECGKFCFTAVKLLKHLRVFHGDKLRCRYKCPLLFSSEEEVSEHYRKFHETATSSACRYCGLDYLSTGLLQNHLKGCTKRPREKRSFTCKNCGDVFDYSRDYKRHLTNCTLSKDPENIH